MSSEQLHNCIFCKEGFESKEELQTHFRKHGDPNYNHNKNKSQNTEQDLDKKPGGQNEMVECDVCTESFSTISKAITHKHKVHPAYDTKYFCPWCGKLFTLKHLYNKHLKTNHIHEKETNNTFYCDSCSVGFFVPAAMLYHNKFFHRQDTDLPAIGHSKKLRSVNQEVLLIYYCPFCGEEYDNKVNLHKHVLDDHSDENQSPEDVLRCPLCDAVFYHLDAYEVHLTFHSTEDMYSEKNELIESITDFSLESVPPSSEKVEDCKPNEDPESCINEIGIDKFLELAMDSSNTPASEKIKKKKHKKSKKSAITLDEFLNMNKDVFGEGIDFQGVEEIPTRVVAKRLKTVKKAGPSAKSISTPELEKLRKQGIVVKTPTNNQFGTVKMKKVIQNKLLKSAQNIPVNQLKAQTPPSVSLNVLSTSNEVLTKLMNQTNSQIKIVKKSTKPDNLNDVPNNDPVSSKMDVEKDELSKIHDSNAINKSDRNLASDTESDFINNDKELSEKSSPTSKISVGLVTKQEDNVNAENTGKSNSLEVLVDSSSKHVDKESVVEEIQEHVGTPTEFSNNSSSSVSALKYLSHLTVKSVNATPSPKAMEQGTNDSHESEFEEELEPKISQKNVSALNSLKNLSQNISFKSVAPVKHQQQPTNKVPEKEPQPDPDSDNNDDCNRILAIKTVTPGRPIFAVSHKSIPSKEILNHENNTDGKTIKPSNTNLLKHLTNITAKPVRSIKLENHQMSQTPKTIKCIKNSSSTKMSTPKVTKEDIEIFNIDSDSDEEMYSKELKTDDSEPVSNINNIKVIRKNITVNEHTNLKNKPNCNIDSFSDEDDVNLKAMGQKGPLNHALMSLSKDITVKSRHSSPNPSVKSQDQKSQDSNADKNDSDSDSLTNNVKITEMENSDDDMPLVPKQIKITNSKNVSVEYPDESNSDQEDDEASDIESHIKTNLLTKSSVNSHNPDTALHLNKLNNIGKNLTIKSLSSQGRASPETKSVASAGNNQLKMKSIKNESQGQTSNNINSIKSCVTQPSNNASINRNLAGTNTVNKEVTVKTYQTQTVIEEITTTVTKTIKTVNQSEIKQEVQSSNRAVTAQKMQGIKLNPQVKNFQGVVVRQSSPAVGSKVRGIAPVRSQMSQVRPSNQLVPVKPGPRAARPSVPRMPNTRHVRPHMSSSQQSPQIGKPLKISPNAVVKRPTSEDASGPFSCFKKPKESLIPDFSPFDHSENEDKMFASTTKASKTNFASMTKMVKGNSVVTTTQMKSETSASSQQLSRLQNMSGLSVVKTSQAKQCHVEERTEMSAAKRNTLDAIQKLQKQGLLVKKPRLEASEEQGFSDQDPEDDNDGYKTSEDDD